MRRESITAPSAAALANGRPAHMQQQQQQQLESRPKFGAWRHAGACLAFVGVIVLVSSSPRDDRASARPAMASARMDAMLADAEAKVAVAKAAELKAQAELARIRALRKTEALPPSAQQATMPTASATTTASTIGATVTGASAQQLQGEFAVAHHRLVASIEPPRLLSRFAALCAGLAPAVAVRPAPARSLSARVAAEFSPWQWADSPARLSFSPDGIDGLVTTPWADGRWGSLPGHPGLLWASFASRDHILWVRGYNLVSHRCRDNETVLVTSVTGGIDTARAISSDRCKDLLSRLTVSWAASVAATSCAQPGVQTAAAATPAAAKAAAAAVPAKPPHCWRVRRRGPWAWLEGRQVNHPALLHLGSNSAALAERRACLSHCHACPQPASGGAPHGILEACTPTEWKCASESTAEKAGRGGGAFEVILVEAPLRAQAGDGHRPASALVQSGREALVIPCSALTAGADQQGSTSQGACGLSLAISVAADAEDLDDDDEDEGDEADADGGNT